MFASHWRKSNTFAPGKFGGMTLNKSVVYFHPLLLRGGAKAAGNTQHTRTDALC